VVAMFAGGAAASCARVTGVVHGFVHAFALEAFLDDYLGAFRFVMIHARRHAFFTDACSGAIVPV